MVPDGTATLDRTMVAHDAWDLLADEAPFDPEKVQLARFCRALSREGAGVTAGAATRGSATGLESTWLAPSATRRRADDTGVILLAKGVRNLAIGVGGNLSVTT